MTSQVRSSEEDREYIAFLTSLLTFSSLQACSFQFACNHTIPRHVMLWHVMVRYVMLCHVTIDEKNICEM